MKKILILKPDGSVNELFVFQTVDENVMVDILKGDIEEIPYFLSLAKENIALLQNESAKLMNLPPTIRVVSGGTLIDVICGNIMVVGTDEENYIGLNDSQISLIKKVIKTAEVAYPTPFLMNTIL